MLPAIFRALRLGVLVACALLLAACSLSPKKSGDRPAGSVSTGKSVKGGGYYKDDGPGGDIPDNLDDIPDAVPRLEPIRAANSRPYSVLGKSYVPYTSLRPYKQRGVASWYGKKFHGEKTSIGEPYDMYAMSAAHTLLALPSYVRVTNLSNGKSVVVRVIDRGPFHADRIIDLSYTAAWKLGLVSGGSGMVEVEAIIPGKNDAPPPVQVTQNKTPPPPPSAAAAKSPPPPAQPSPVTSPASRATEEKLAEMTMESAAEAAAEGKDDDLAEFVRAAQAEADAISRGDIQTSIAPGIYIQLGAFSNVDNAAALRAHLSRELDWVTEPIIIYAADRLLRVHLGPYPSRGEAERVAERIRVSLGYRPTYANY